MRILFVGGGTVGSVAPLLALSGSIRALDEQATFLFIGSSRGPERALVESAHIPFKSISAGKLRRYASWKNITDIAALTIGFFQAYGLLRKYQPDAIVSAGSFVAVPVVWAGKFLGIPSVIHQQDIVPGLANRICQPAAKKITVAFESSLKHYPKNKVTWTGNPVRSQLAGYSPSAARKKFNLKDTVPTILAFGGGTGALRLNQLIAEAGLGLVKHVQILHITGGRENTFQIEDPNYRSVEFLTDDMAAAYAAADIVVCRSGLSTLSELSALGKPAIVIPIPNTHQEKNAEYFREHKAIIQLDERRTNHNDLEAAILGLLQDVERRDSLIRNIRALGRPDAGDRIAAIVVDIARPRELRRVSAAISSVIHEVHANEPLSKHTNFKLGGPAAIFAVARHRQEIIRGIEVLRKENATFFVLGGGANVVFPDNGISGVVLQIRNDEFTVDEEYVEIGAGVNTGKAASLCLQAGLTGLEFIVGIYGTIGGAVRGNAGSFGTEMKNVVVSCDVLTESGTVETWSHDRLRFGYRDSIAKHSRTIILSARLKLTRGDAAAARKLIAEHSAYKREHQPLKFPSAGCMFKNYVLQAHDDAARQAFPEFVASGKIPAWALVTGAGFAGRRIGNIQISDQHANFFLNLGGGTADHVIMLASLVKQKVRERYAVQLQEEVQFIGFPHS